MSDDHQFNPTRIFLYLLLYTVLEVAWGMFFPGPRWALWGGLLICAYLKGYLIFTWFMHMKFEGWIVKGLVAPTIPLVAILIFANMPDTSLNDDMLYPIGSQLDVKLVQVNGTPAYDEDGDAILDALGDPVLIYDHRIQSQGEVTSMPDETPAKAITEEELNEQKEKSKGH